ncbi:MAG TPA: hypothetical protein VKD67_02450 [Acidimicrobiales bacterium]|nr:hypothetical protein [Acidimicrobiales bacterium]
MGDLLNIAVMGDGWDLLDELLGVLIALSLVCSDASLAYAYARLGKQWAARAVVGSGRCEPGGRAGHDDYPAAVESAQRCGIAYAAAATQLAAAAAAAASHLAAGQPPPVPQPGGLEPSDILASPHQHVPLVQFPPGLMSGSGLRLAELNADLTMGHARLMVAIDRLWAGGVPLSVFDAAAQAPDRRDGIDVGGGFPAALHAYGADCVWALALLNRAGITPKR